MSETLNVEKMIEELRTTVAGGLMLTVGAYLAVYYGVVVAVKRGKVGRSLAF